MSVLKSKDGKNLILNCKCGCDEAVRFQVDKEDYDMYVILSYMNGSFYRDQGETFWRVFYKKIRKILSIVRNKDFYHNEVILTKDDWQEFKEYINSI